MTGTISMATALRLTDDARISASPITVTASAAAVATAPGTLRLVASTPRSTSIPMQLANEPSVGLAADVAPQDSRPSTAAKPDDRVAWTRRRDRHLVTLLQRLLEVEDDVTASDYFGWLRAQARRRPDAFVEIAMNEALSVEVRANAAHLATAAMTWQRGAAMLTRLWASRSRLVRIGVVEGLEDLGHVGLLEQLRSRETDPYVLQALRAALRATGIAR